MRVNELITESLSRIVFHYTGIRPALQILRSGNFELGSTLGSVEEQYAPKGHPYFLSTTRTRRGGYHEYVGSSAVLFQLNGDWFNNRYISKPVDYWLNRDPKSGSHRPHEAEDRVYSKEPTIPIGGVTAIYVYISPEAEDNIRAYARHALIAAKRLGIETYFYTDEEAWRNFDKRPEKLGDVTVLRGQERTGGYTSTHPGYLLPWIELLHTKDKSQLSKRADRIRYDLQYTYNKEESARSLNNDLSNARKPGSGPDRKHVGNIIKYMRQNNISSVRELVDHLAKKWSDKS